MTTPTGPQGPLAGPAVVLVPGLGLDQRSWAQVRRILGPSASVVTLPSMGRRGPRGTDLHVEAQAARVLDALPATGEAVLVGHSASAPVVVEAAARSPRVVGLVLVGPVTDPGARTWPGILRQWAGTVVHERVWETLALTPQYRATGLSSMLRGMNRIRFYRTEVGLAAASVPTLVVRGENDRIAPGPWCERLAAAAGTPLTTVPGAAHMVPLTHPAAVVAAVRRLEALRR
ncbi:alpha/beta fold hydrolase [Phycicoccus duodecadis]|uniref:Pimeloyl-ACP methyl ester carboxylesterase n=1 Tax=Phycicoccus duodecadis TaxID=173053 RepID=A0A2N3YI80_9MICO|nr:alpha/beta hydrolase [Phycicoccus duodecadis]PKW26567.1 pimeloyl-ACP methyl ester carboxylesterase [Phycicoccus duodecadis]